MDALDELISSKQQRVEMIGEDESLSELVCMKKWLEKNTKRKKW